MTEFEAAMEFVKDYAEAVAVAIQLNERLEDWSAYSRHCEDQGLQPTQQRLRLARDIAIAAREYAAGRERKMVSWWPTRRPILATSKMCRRSSSRNRSRSTVGGQTI